MGQFHLPTNTLVYRCVVFLARIAEEITSKDNDFTVPNKILFMITNEKEDQQLLNLITLISQKLSEIPKKHVIGRFSKHQSLIRVLAYLLISLTLNACGGGGTQTPPIVVIVPPSPALEIVTTSPIEQSVFVDPFASISIVFNTSINESLLQQAFSMNIETDGVLTYDAASLTATYTPSTRLDFATVYQITLDTNFISAGNTTLTDDFILIFRTAGEVNAIQNGGLGAAILNLASRNSASNTDFTALAQALDIMGIPYFSTDNLSEALSSRLVYLASFVNQDTFTSEEQTQLTNYLNTGGTLVSRSLSATALYQQFGISDQLRINSRMVMNWNLATADSSLHYINTPQEETISLGKTSNSSTIFTRSYTLEQGTALAYYEDNSVAVVKNTVGAGSTYLLGVSFSDVILRNQMDLDFDADRGRINSHEPTTDTFLLFLRAIYEIEMPFATWKHTSLAKSRASLIISHDVDSQSSADWMTAFASLEAENGISASYNINTHYINDAIDGDFYTMNTDIYRAAIEQGHSISSHSVGHFPDFDDDLLFPIGSPGNTMENYQPYFDGNETSGATVFGELEVSRDLLETDLGVMVKTFRSGHLLWNENQPSVMEELGYKYDSSFSSNDVLTSFPYRVTYQKAISSPLSSIYEFPLNSSDSVSGEQSADETAAIWLNVLNANIDNGALTVLLIHPNRDYKVEELRAYIAGIPEGISINNMDVFGDYWAARDSFNYDASIIENTLTITLSVDIDSIHQGISLWVKNGSHLANLDIRTSGGQSISYDLEFAENGDLLIYQLMIEH